MKHTRIEWVVIINSGDYRPVDLQDLLKDWEADEKSAAGCADEATEEIRDLTATVKDLNEQLAEPPEWGNCRRGCPPSYLNQQGYCSPACEKGYPKGLYVGYELPDPAVAPI